MAYKDFMNKVRYWDNMASKWMMRHIYFMFFQIVLAVAFIYWLTNTFTIIDISLQSSQSTVVEKILLTQSTNLTIIVFLMFLSCFWLLYIFSGMQRAINLLKDVSYHISRLRMKQK